MFFRRRLIFWLISAYIKKWGKVLFLSFVSGLLIFFVVTFSYTYFRKLIPIYKHDVIGIAGAYTTDNLPPEIIRDLSRGLTKVDENGKVMPEIASSWEIKDGGKTYIFHLKNNLFLADGRSLTSDQVNYNFVDAKVSRPNKYTIVYKLKDSYAPFLVTVSRPIFQSGLVGIGKYRIDDVKLNGSFVQSIVLVGVKNKFDIKTYQFYPNVESLKEAYALGEINKAYGLNNLDFNRANFDDFGNTVTKKAVNYQKLVTVFFNNNDDLLSDKKIRLALSYSLPDDFEFGEVNPMPYPSKSIYYNSDIELRKQSFEHARLLLLASDAASESAKKQTKINISLKTLAKYRKTADLIARNFVKTGINTSVEEVDRVPNDYQIFLGDFVLSDDPDQYMLWHSDNIKNITKYKNLRIDKLLEDGRKTIDFDDRRKIYADFQKFLLEDAPAAFLYFPVEYELARK